MLTGVLPYRGNSMAELMHKITNELVPDIRIIRAEPSEKLTNIVTLFINKRPETRYQDGEQFAAVMRPLRADFAGLTYAASASAAIGGHSGVAADAVDLDTTRARSAAVFKTTQAKQVRISTLDKPLPVIFAATIPKLE